MKRDQNTMHLFEVLLNIEGSTEYAYRPHLILQDRTIMKDIDCEIDLKMIRSLHARCERYNNNMIWVEFEEENNNIPTQYITYTLMKLENILKIINLQLENKKFKCKLVFKRKFFHLEVEET